MTPLFSLTPAAVLTSEAADKREILGQLAQAFSQVYSLDNEAVFERLAEREALGSTGFGRGVAIPHARMAGLGRLAVIVLRLEGPVDFKAADDLPVDLVFGLLSPENAGVTHLHALAAISRLVRDERMRDMLMEASDDEALYALLSNVTGQDAA